MFSLEKIIKKINLKIIIRFDTTTSGITFNEL